MNKKLLSANVFIALSILLFALALVLHRSVMMYGSIACSNIALGFGVWYYRSLYLEHRLHPEAEMLRSHQQGTEHVQYDREAWREAIDNRNTERGYWEWLSTQLNQRDSQASRPFTVLK